MGDIIDIKSKKIDENTVAYLEELLEKAKQDELEGFGVFYWDKKNPDGGVILICDEHENRQVWEYLGGIEALREFFLDMISS